MYKVIIPIVVLFTVPYVYILGQLLSPWDVVILESRFSKPSLCRLFHFMIFSSQYLIHPQVSQSFLHWHHRSNIFFSIVFNIIKMILWLAFNCITI